MGEDISHYKINTMQKALGMSGNNSSDWLAFYLAKHCPASMTIKKFHSIWSCATEMSALLHTAHHLHCFFVQGSREAQHFLFCSHCHFLKCTHTSGFLLFPRRLQDRQRGGQRKGAKKLSERFFLAFCSCSTSCSHSYPSLREGKTFGRTDGLPISRWMI